MTLSLLIDRFDLPRQHICARGHARCHDRAPDAPRFGRGLARDQHDDAISHDFAFHDIPLALSFSREKHPSSACTAPAALEYRAGAGRVTARMNSPTHFGTRQEPRVRAQL